MPTTLVARTAPVAASPTVPVAVSTAVAPLLRAPAAGQVLAVFPSAVYVRLASGAVVAVVTSDGLRLPNALVVAAISRQAPFARHRAGGPAAVDGGALVLDGARYVGVRSWTPRERTPGVLQPGGVAELGALLDAGPPPHTGATAQRLHAGTALLGAAVGAGGVLEEAAEALLGLGPGLTPAGDDVLGGALVACAHLGRPQALHVRPRATAALSADLLSHAVHGRAAPPVLALLEALVGTRPGAPALTDLLAVGSTSGHDTATGVLVAARALLHRREAA